MWLKPQLAKVALWQQAWLRVLSSRSMIPDCTRTVKQLPAAFGVGGILADPSQYPFAALECSDVPWPAEQIESFAVRTPAPVVMLRRADHGLLSFHDGQEDALRDFCCAGCIVRLPFLLQGKGIAMIRAMKTYRAQPSLLYQFAGRCLVERFAPLCVTAHTLPETPTPRDTVKQQIAPGVIVPSRGVDQDLYRAVCTQPGSPSILLVYRRECVIFKVCRWPLAP